VAELTIHGLDILRALEASVPVPPVQVPGPPVPVPGPLPGPPVPVPPEALAESLRCVTERIVRQGTGAVALLALSGRSPLPPGFSAY
jgi:hypothetical protein